MIRAATFKPKKERVGISKDRYQTLPDPPKQSISWSDEREREQKTNQGARARVSFKTRARVAPPHLLSNARPRKVPGPGFGAFGRGGKLETNHLRELAHRRRLSFHDGIPRTNGTCLCSRHLRVGNQHRLTRARDDPQVQVEAGLDSRRHTRRAISSHDLAGPQPGGDDPDRRCSVQPRKA